MGAGLASGDGMVSCLAFLALKGLLLVPLFYACFADWAWTGFLWCLLSLRYIPGMTYMLYSPLRMAWARGSCW